MRFTEREMTVGVQAAAREMLAAAHPTRRRDPDAEATAWKRLDAMERYRRISAAGDLVLPVLLALPERPTVGATPAFTDAEWERATREGQQVDPDAKPGRRQRLMLTSVTMLTRTAVAAMPVRRDPDALIVPDDLSGL